MASRLQLLIGADRGSVGGRSFTAQYSDLKYSNVDPGGFEQLTATITDPTGLEVGREVVVRYGLDVSWHGRLNEIAPSARDGRAGTQITALGYGAKLTDERMQVVYGDQDISAWKSSSRTQQIANISAGYSNNGPSTSSDEAGGTAIKLAFTGAWVLTGYPISEAMYDAGDGCLIGSVYYEWTRNANVNQADAAWTWIVKTTTSDNLASGEDSTADLRAAGPGSGTLTATGSRRFAFLRHYYSAAGGAAGTEYAIDWRKVVVYGNHGLTKRGSDPKGFYPHDIVKHARDDYEAANFGGLTSMGFRPNFELITGDSSSLIVRHAVYRDPTPHQKIIADMATLMGWHYGVWEPRSIMSSVPRLFFTAPPVDVTCVVARNEFQEFDPPRVRVDLLYDTAKVRYADPAGVTGVETVTLTNPFIPLGAKFAGRVLDLDMGQGDQSSAQAFGAFALQLALAGARGGGSGTIPDTVVVPGGGRKAACLLRSGRDRLRIMDLSGSGSLTALDTDRQDSFLVRRVETAAKNGQPVTRVEFDGGADLLEVLQARLQLAAFG